MSQIAVDFLAGHDASSRLIEWFGMGHWSHCTSVLQDGRYLDSRNDWIGGVPPGVRIRWPATESWVRKCRATLEVTPAEYAIWEAGLRTHISSGYDKDAILGFLEGRSIHSAGKWICSALAINGVQHLGRSWTGTSLAVGSMQHIGYVPFPLSSPAHEVTPGALLLILRTAGFTIGPVLHAG